MSIDWEKFAKLNGLSPESFCKEVLETAACIAAMKIDEQDYKSAMRFTCEDSVSEIEVYVRRVAKKK